MDGTHQGTAALRPLLARAVGDPEIASSGVDDLDWLMKATELVVAEITAGSRAGAERESSAIRHHSDQAIARRRLELHGLRSELLDRATGLALRFEALLDEIDLADAELARAGAGESREQNEQIAAIRMVVGDRQKITEPAEMHAQPIVFEHPPEPAPSYARQSVQRRRWWHRLRGEAA